MNRRCWEASAESRTETKNKNHHLARCAGRIMLSTIFCSLVRCCPIFSLKIFCYVGSSIVVVVFFLLDMNILGISGRNESV